MDTATHILRTGRRGALFELQMAFRDLKASTERLDLAWSLAWHDVVSRYRGSILGPVWITLSMGVMVLGIGVLWGGLFRVPIHSFIPPVAIGIVFFGVVTSTINEGCDTFVQAAGMLSQTSLPMFTFVWRSRARTDLPGDQCVLGVDACGGDFGAFPRHSSGRRLGHPGRRDHDTGLLARRSCPAGIPVDPGL